ncbi:MAG: hypothetical protein M1813_000662 [Trichoglossum hirsutum]|nr:MAG: hypothetical protein M1813_000662 [Trichoglossum hirsutum]
MRRLSEGDISTRFPAFVSKEALEKKLIPEERTETDRHSRIMCRILEAQALLAEHEPDKEEVVNLASGLCNGMIEVLEVVSVDVDTFFNCFRVYMMVTDSSVGQRENSLRAIVLFQFPRGPESLSTRRIIQAMISHTCFKYTLEKLNPYPDGCLILRVLGDSGNQYLEPCRDLLRAWIGKAADIGTWKLNGDGRVADEDLDRSHRNAACIVLGLPLSLRPEWR